MTVHQYKIGKLALSESLTSGVLRLFQLGSLGTGLEYNFQCLQIKCHASSCSECGKPSDVELDSAVIPGVRVVRHLGVILTESLEWSHHISFLLRRVSPSVGLLRHLTYRVGSALLVKRLYVGLVRQVLEYASPVWDSCTKSEALSLERLKLSASRW